MSMRIMTEACGSLVAGQMIKAIQEAGHTAVGSDIDTFNAGYCLADGFITVPRYDMPNLWEATEQALIENNIDIVLPSFDETLHGWALRKEHFAQKGIHVIISPAETIAIFQDKWETYKFFENHNIPCPATALDQKYPLVKPRQGRGSEGVRCPETSIPMDGLISQEIATGEEYTIDALFDREGQLIYCVPRKRLGVQKGKSTRGIVLRNDGIVRYVKKISQKARFIGPVNLQCFIEGDSISFIEINPRIAGGMALGFAATENWITPMINNLVHRKAIIPRTVQYGMKMARYYAECFIP